jgi:hypothetical protein
VKATSKFLELDLLYGGATGIGVSVTDSSANINTTSTTITLRLSSWAPAIFAGMENAQVVFYREGTATLVSSGADSIFTIVSQNVTPASSLWAERSSCREPRLVSPLWIQRRPAYKLAIYWNSATGTR